MYHEFIWKNRTKSGKLIVFFDVMVVFPTKIMRLMGEKIANIHENWKQISSASFSLLDIICEIDGSLIWAWNLFLIRKEILHD